MQDSPWNATLLFLESVGFLDMFKHNILYNRPQITQKYHYFIYSNVGGYIRVTSGSTCERVTSKAECEEAARQLGLSDTVALEESKSNWPPYCYVNINALYFNINGTATSHCNSNSRICICKETSGKILRLILESFLPVPVEVTEHV